MTAIETDRFLLDNTQSEDLDLVTGLFKANWNGTLTQTFTVTFKDLNAI